MTATQATDLEVVDLEKTPHTFSDLNHPSILKVVPVERRPAFIFVAFCDIEVRCRVGGSRGFDFARKQVHFCLRFGRLDAVPVHLSEILSMFILRQN